MSLCSTSETLPIRARMLILALVAKLATFSREEELTHSRLHRRRRSTFCRGPCVGGNNSTRSSFDVNIYLEFASSSSCTNNKLKTCFSQVFHRHIISKTRLSEDRNPFCQTKCLALEGVFRHEIVQPWLVVVQRKPRSHLLQPA